MGNNETEPTSKRRRVADVSFSLQYDLQTKINIPYYLEDVKEDDIKVFVRDQMENKNPWELLPICKLENCYLYQVDDIEIRDKTDKEENDEEQ